MAADVLSNIAHRIGSSDAAVYAQHAAQLRDNALLDKLHWYVHTMRMHDVLAVSLHVCRSDVIQAYCDYGLHAKNVRTQHS